MKKQLMILLAVCMIILPSIVVGKDKDAKKAIELRFATNIPSMAPDVKVYHEWADKINKDTEGRVHITVYADSTLLNEMDMLAGIERGIVQIGDVGLIMDTESFPLTNILQLPLLFLGDDETYRKLWVELENKFPEMKAETKNFKKVNKNFVASAGGIHTRDKAIVLPEDLKGVRMMTGGSVLGDVLKALGASVVSLPVTDWYTSLDRGILDGITGGIHVVVEARLYPLLPYHTDSEGTVAQVSSGYQLMNLDAWNKLSPNDQAVFEKNSGFIAERLSIINSEKNANAMAVCQKEGHHFTWLTKEQQQIWYKAALPAHKAYIEKVAARGLPAQEFYDEMMRLAAQYNK